jgi:lipopolysaccharide O-acetyltransferase
LGGEEYIEIGDQVFIGACSWLQVIVTNGCCDKPAIRIGDGTAISGFCTITAVRQVVIGKRVLIARYVYISDHCHAHSSLAHAILDQGITGVKSVHIRDGAWLGQGVIVCPGVTIGRNAVIGANSVVRHDIPDYCVAAGVPAKVIRRIDHTKA